MYFWGWDFRSNDVIPQKDFCLHVLAGKFGLIRWVFEANKSYQKNEQMMQEVAGVGFKV